MKVLLKFQRVPSLSNKVGTSASPCTFYTIHVCLVFFRRRCQEESRMLTVPDKMQIHIIHMQLIDKILMTKYGNDFLEDERVNDQEQSIYSFGIKILCF